MSAAITVVGPHPEDAALVRLLDGEGSDVERAQLAAHVATCPECEGRRRLLTEWSQELSDLLTRTDATPRAFSLRFERRAPRPWWRVWPAAAAAALLVLSAVAVFASPVRTWVVERWADVRRLLHAPGGSPVQTPGRAASDTVGAVSFTLSSDVLVVRVATRQAEGSLLIEATVAGTASAVVRGAGDREELVVLPDELRIANSAASRASYRVTVPTRLKRVVVLIGAEPPVYIAPVLSGESRELDLSRPDRR